MTISKLGENITLYRKKRGYSIKKLSEMSSVAYATIYNIENGKNESLKTQTLEKVAESLGVATADLLGEEIIEHTVSSLEDTFDVILESDSLTVDSKELNDVERILLKSLLTNIIKTIKDIRS